MVNWSMLCNSKLEQTLGTRLYVCFVGRKVHWDIFLRGEHFSVVEKQQVAADVGTFPLSTITPKRTRPGR